MQANWNEWKGLATANDNRARKVQGGKKGDIMHPFGNLLESGRFPRLSESVLRAPAATVARKEQHAEVPHSSANA
jgi:hypothetical protein